MGRISVTPQQVYDAGKEFILASEQSRKMVDAIEEKFVKILPDWEGMHSYRFYQDYVTWRASMVQWAELLFVIGSQLIATGERGLEPGRDI